MRSQPSAVLQSPTTTSCYSLDEAFWTFNLLGSIDFIELYYDKVHVLLHLSCLCRNKNVRSQILAERPREWSRLFWQGQCKLAPTIDIMANGALK